MGYKKTINIRRFLIMAETKALAKTLLTNEEVAKNFLIVDEQMDKYEAISKSVEIKDDESLAIAENNIASIKTLITRTKAAHKVVKNPYLQTSRAIDLAAKVRLERLEAYKDRIALPITNWKSVQEAARRADLEKKRIELEEQAQEKTLEADQLARLTRTVYAKLHGGTFFTKDGEEKIASGCETEEECQALSRLVMEKFPAEEAFNYFPDKRNKTVEKAIKDIRKHQVNLMEMKSLTPGIVKEAKRRIKASRLEAGMEAEKIKESLEKKIDLATRKEVKEGEKEVKDAAKNTRKILKMAVVDPEKVTAEFLSVDEAKIRLWMEGKNDLIKEMLKEGKQPLSGIEFSVETTYIAR